MERSGDSLRMIEEIVDQLRNGIGADAIEIEIARNRTNFFCYHGKGCAGKLGAFARDSDIIISSLFIIVMAKLTIKNN